MNALHQKLEAPLRALVPLPSGGHCLMSGFPGLETGFDGEPYLDPGRATETLAAIRAAGADALIILAESVELPEGAHQMLRDLTPADLALHFLPCVDFAAPDATFVARWRQVRPAVRAGLARGGAVAMACQYGAGRSGLMAALLLIEDGVPPKEAIRLVRARFHEAIESEVQEAWLMAQADAA